MYRLERDIEILYKKFFKKNGINFRNGKLNGHDLKFATYPFIGSRYRTKKGVLFIGLDLGKDESRGILRFSEKRRVVEGMNDNLKKMNVHIAGTYITAIYFLRKKAWEGIRLAKSYKAAIKLFQMKNDPNMLSCVAFTNLFKYVTLKRFYRLGGENRRHISKDREEELLLNEIKIFEPKLIVFQSRTFYDKKYKSLLGQVLLQNPRSLIFIAPHPSYHGDRKPNSYLALFQKFNT
ncbi:MAG: hypothetical protein Q8O83_04015 [bacterium]|nr:hypothetical protein [bacterium]